MEWKAVFSACATALIIGAYVPYIASIVSGKTRPHIFSWVIWASTTLIVFFAQLQAKAGMGAWPTGVSALIAMCIVVLVFIKRTDTSIKPLDWCFLVFALSSLPVWYMTTDPLWAVVMLTCVDLLGFGPTMRKAYVLPHEENRAFFLSFMFSNLFVILAMENYSLTTCLFPAAISIGCFCLVVLVSIRRRACQVENLS